MVVWRVKDLSTLQAILPLGNFNPYPGWVGLCGPRMPMSYFAVVIFLCPNSQSISMILNWCPQNNHSTGNFFFWGYPGYQHLPFSDMAEPFLGLQVPAGFIPYGRDGKPESVGSGAAAKVMAQCPKRTAPVRGQLTKTLDWRFGYPLVN